MQRIKNYKESSARKPITIKSKNIRESEVYKKWRQIENLNNEGVWKKKLSLLKITEKELEDILYNSYNMPSQNDRSFIKELLSINLQDIKIEDFYGEEEKQNFFTALFPFYILSMGHLKREIDHINIKHKEILGSERLINELAHQFCQKVKTYLYPALVVEYHCVLATDLIDHIEKSKKFKHYACNISNTPEWIEYFFEEYPVLNYYMRNALSNWLKATICFIKRIDKDLISIYKNFNIPGNSLITEIQIFMGDLHRGWQTTSRLKFSNGSMVFYKPRSLKAETQFQKFYNKLLNMNFETSLSSYMILDKEDYGWVENIKCIACKDENEVKKFFRNQGLNLSISYVLGINDLIYDNIIANGEKPSFIDLECILSPVTIPNEKNFTSCLIDPLLSCNWLCQERNIR